MKKQKKWNKKKLAKVEKLESLDFTNTMDSASDDDADEKKKNALIKKAKYGLVMKILIFWILPVRITSVHPIQQ